MPTKQEKKRRKFLYLQQRFPDVCFCENKCYLESEVIKRMIEPYESPYFNVIQEMEIIVYKCSKCGREYDNRPAIAA
jgi:hypothetical protein